jgi:hypothetical protein
VPLELVADNVNVTVAVVQPVGIPEMDVVGAPVSDVAGWEGGETLDGALVTGGCTGTEVDVAVWLACDPD